MRGYASIVWLSAIAFALWLLPVASLTAQSGAPDVIPFQGLLTDGAGDPLSDGTYALTFRLYEAASGGSAIWTEPHTGGNEIQVADGIFNVTLGSLQSLAGIGFNQQLYLGITVEVDPEITPRTPLGSSPYALSMRDIYSVGDKVTISAQVGIGTTPTTRDLTVNDIASDGDVILNMTAADKELIVGLNASSHGILRTTTNHNLNLGSNNANRLTVRADGDIYIPNDLLLGASDRRAMLTMRGPDNAENGPVLFMFGDGSDQVESGRVRFVEGTSSSNWRGAFIHYDGSANALHIGTHNTSDKTTGNDLSAITIGRSSRDVTIHEDLLAEGDVLKDYGNGSFTPTTVFAMGALDASDLGLDFSTSNILFVLKNTGGAGYYVIYFDESCPTSNARVPYVASITMYDSGVDDISAEPICRSSVACGGLSRCVSLEIRPYNLFGFVDDLDFQFIVHKVN